MNEFNSFARRYLDKYVEIHDTKKAEFFNYEDRVYCRLFGSPKIKDGVPYYDIGIINGEI